MERSRRTWTSYLIPAIAIGLLIAACTDDMRQPTSPPVSPAVPSYAKTTPFNSTGACLAVDAFLSGAVNGVNDSTDLADPTKNCTSNDVRIARAIIDSVSNDGGVTYQQFNGQAIPCTIGQTVFVSLAAQLNETATSARSDIGIWIAMDGGNARTGSCNHYNLTNVGILLDSTRLGVTNTDNDYCGDMNAGDSTIVGLGKITLICQSSPTSADSLHVGSCLGWTQPGGDQVCPVGLVESPQAFRNGSVPGTTSKCNCAGFNVPIVVNQFARLEVKKVCAPTTDPGKFNLQIDGSTFGTGADASCGGTTGIDTVTAGTSANPGVSHSFGETAGTATSLSKYSSSRVCVNRVGGANRLASGAGTGGSLTLQPNDDVICTITNTRLNGKIELVKSLSPTNDPGKFNLFIRAGSSGGAIQDSATDVGNNGTTGSGGTSLPPGSYHLSEAAGTGTSLSDYTSTAASCVIRGTATPVTVTAGVVAIDSNDDIVCTITNTRNTGKLELVKALVPTNDPGKFNLFIRAGTSGGSIVDSATDVGNNGTTGAGGTTLNTGNYFVGEAAGTGTSIGDYQVTGPSCVLRGTATPVTVTAGVLALANNADVVCTITNTRNPGKLELIKSLSPTNDPGKFNLFIRAGSSGGAIQDSATDVGNNGTTGAGGTSLPPGSYFVGEAAGTGTSAGDYTTTGPACVLRGTATPVTVTAGVLTLASNADVVCTITNTRNTGKLELVKSLSPTNDPGKFNLFIRAGSSGGAIQDSATDVGNNGTTGAGGTTLNTGNYFVGEAAGTGTSASDYTTTGPACVLRGTATPVSVAAGVLTLANNADVVCTITNTRNTGKLELVKVTAPTNDPGKFNLFIRAGSSGGAIADSATDVGNGGTTGAGGTTLNTGNYFVGEAAGTGTSLADYSVTGPSCVLRGTATPVTVAAGVLALANNADVVCTITNTRSPGKLELIKSLSPTSDPGKFNLFIRLNTSGGAIQDSATDVGNNGTTGAGGTSLAPGNYFVGEGAGTGTSIGDYTVTGPACVLRGTATPVTVTAGVLALASNQDIVCTITNTRNPGKIELIKSLSPTNDPGKFNLFIRAGTSGGAIQDSATDVGNNGTTGAGGTTLPVGNYFVGEAAGTGTSAGDYTTTGPACVLRGTATSVTVTAGVLTLASNADVVCTITNTRNTGKLELKKATVPTNDVGKFNLFIRAGSAAGSIADSATDVGNGGTTGAGGTTLNTGTYNVGEAAGTGTSLDDYVVTGPSCVLRGTATPVTVTAGNLSLTNGADVVCTITNSRKAVLIVDKVLTGGGSQLFDFSQTGIANFQLADATTPKKTTGLLPNTYTVCELALAVAWNATFTVNGSSVTPTVNGTTGDACYGVVLNYGDSTTVVVTNTPPPGGGTRTIGYWKNWSSCAQSNGGQYDKAIAKGMPEATLDHYINPAITPNVYPLGDITELTCLQAVNLLAKNAIDGTKRAGDPIYNMVAQMLGAKLNVAAQAGTCPTLLTALGQAQTFLDALNFTGLGSYKGVLSASDQNLVNGWAGIFGSYNEGTLGGGCPTHI